ncbi:MAG TPA: class I SAM-dependent methyltransferase [Pseudonocardiaceae bacterium]
MGTMGQSGTGPGAIAPDGSPVEYFARLRTRGEPEIVHGAVAANAGILELGAGAGRVTNALVALGHPVVAVDESAEMLAHVQAETVCASIEDLALDRLFDVVLLGSFLVNSADRELRRRFLATCRAHVRPDGCVLIQRNVPGRRPPADAQVADDGFVATLRYRLGEQTWTHTITNHDVDDEELVSCLREVGLAIDAVLTEDRTWIRAVPLT